MVVDDDDDMRELLERRLKRWQHEVVVADNGLKALEILKEEDIQFVITDWMMPEMNGLELCKAVRAGSGNRYIYIMLLTGKAERNDLVEGIEAGADDFIVKPFKKEELQVRIRAGLRVLEFERQKEQALQEVRAKHQALEEANKTIHAHLEAAGRLQQAMLPQHHRTFNDFRFESLFVPCEYVAGDMFNYFQLDEARTAFYLLDVAGHGVPAAMQSVTLSKVINPSTLADQMAVKDQIDPRVPILDFFDPVAMVTKLNQIFLGPSSGTQYFTMFYGVIDTRTRRISLTQAGHPPVVWLKSNGGAELVGDGGYPVGLLRKASYDLIEFSYQPGDRLYLYSDALTDGRNDERESFGQKRMLATFQQYGDLPLREALESVHKTLKDWVGDEVLDDDLSILGLQFLNPE
nr:SpoIIE family protein phosphatase [Acanthopleuribacter pedis]